MQLAFSESLESIGGFGRKPVLAVAVSGGADSLALTLLAAEWAKKHKGRIIALTVDHGLRKESAAEAKYVHKLLAKFGIEHHILNHGEALPNANVQAWARDLRYGLMLEFCKKKKIKHLLLGHQQDDNIETFFLHLERGSGLKGLSGMKPVSSRGPVRLIRPMLEISRAQIDAFLKTKRVKPVNDPTNANTKYRRSALREVLAPFLANTPNMMERLSGSMRYLAEADTVLDAYYEEKKPAILMLGKNTAKLDAKKLVQSPFQLRLIAEAIMHVSGLKQPPRAAELKRALGLKHFTLHGVKGERTAKQLVLVPEKTKPRQGVGIKGKKVSKAT